MHYSTYILDMNLQCRLDLDYFINTRRNIEYQFCGSLPKHSSFYFKPPQKKNSGAGEWPKLFREINVLNNKVVSL